MSNSSMNEERGRALVLTDAAGNMYVIPAEKIVDSLVKESSRDGIKKELEATTPGEDFKLMGTYELATETRRAAYARPRVSIMVGAADAATS